MREYEALAEVREREHERQNSLIRVLRADLHNTAGRSFDKWFQPDDFKPGAQFDVEARAKELIAQGVPPAKAVAMASAKQDKKRSIHLLDKALLNKKGTRKQRA